MHGLFWILRATNHEQRATAFFGLRCGVPPRQIHEMNAVRRPQIAGRRGPADRKKNTRPAVLCVGDAQRASRLWDSITSYSSIMAGFYEPQATNNEPLYYAHYQPGSAKRFQSGLPIVEAGCLLLRPHDFQSVRDGFVNPITKKSRKVYSIWICTMPTKKWEYNISSYQLTEKHLIGHTQAERSHYDLINIVLVCLGSKSHKQLNGILRLLNMLLLDNISSQEKKWIVNEWI